LASSDPPKGGTLAPVQEFLSAFPRDILVGEELTKNDVPIGSEVWLSKVQ
jgi:hypothetical protein